MLSLLEKIIDDVKNNRLSDDELKELGGAIRYYYVSLDLLTRVDKTSNFENLKYYTLGYYVYNFLLEK